MADYKLGSDDPKVRYDRGAGNWHSKKATAKKQVLKRALQGVLPLAKYAIGENARNHMRHYLRNVGEPYVIQTVKKMVEASSAAREVYDRELAQAKKFVETLPPGQHRITSGRATKVTPARRSGRRGGGGQDKNWFFAVGGYSVWGKGEAIVAPAGGGKRHYQIEFEYKFRDRYNWDKGKLVTIGPVTIHDEDMAEFHRQGLAKEFFMYGSWHHVVTWDA